MSDISVSDGAGCPCTRVAGLRGLVRYGATAPAKIVLRRDVPIEPPTCWPVLSVAEAAPVSCGATPNVPVFIDGAIVKPKPSPATTSGRGTPPPNLEGTPILASHTRLPAASSMPAVTSGLGPSRGSSTTLDRLAATTTIAITGRNATPLTTGE